MKGTRITKLISILLSVMMVVTLLPGSALAEAAGNSPDNQENAAGANEDPIQYTVTFVSDGATVGTQTVAAVLGTVTFKLTGTQGKATAKVTTLGAKLSFSSKRWTSIDSEGSCIVTMAAKNAALT